MYHTLFIFILTFVIFLLFFSITISVSLSTPDCFSLRPWSIISVPRLNPSSPIFFPNPGKNLFKTFSVPFSNSLKAAPLSPSPISPLAKSKTNSPALPTDDIVLPITDIGTPTSAPTTLKVVAYPAKATPSPISCILFARVVLNL